MKQRHPNVTTQYDYLTDPTRPPRTTRGLLMYLALPVLLLVGAGALTYPLAFVAGLVGLAAGVGGYHLVRRLVRQHGRTAGDGTDRTPATP